MALGWLLTPSQLDKQEIRKREKESRGPWRYWAEPCKFTQTWVQTVVFIRKWQKRRRCISALLLVKHRDKAHWFSASSTIAALYCIFCLHWRESLKRLLNQDSSDNTPLWVIKLPSCLGLCGSSIKQASLKKREGNLNWIANIHNLYSWISICMSSRACY